MGDQDRLAERFEAHRSHLRGVAYRMLGSLSEAEDAVQEAWVRLSRSDTAGVENLAGWLTRVVARVCLDLLRSRGSRREEPLNPQQPGPIVDRREDSDPEQEALLADTVGLALLVVLDRLAPAERVAFVLHDLFAVPFDEIAPIVERSPTATKKLASRARHRIQGTAPSPDMIDLGTLGGSRSYATGVNDRHEVVGFSETANGVLHAFVWRHGRLIDLGTPEEQTSTATAINNRGVIAGEVRADMNSMVPVLWRHGGRTDLPVPVGEFGAAAQAVNDEGEVAGYSFGPAGNSAFLWQDGRVTALGTLPGSTSARAYGINNDGQVVGDTDFDAFRWQNGQMTALPDLVSTSSAADINNLGQIVGHSATTAEGANAHAVLWTR